ncbi:hypothetical protein EVAR_55218_1 [Eumeta japonica]|uniref:Uncharacterized protein n=1 Tax=Eumeta variegata TaxID=151549 RepID=A0A4C1ZRE5_EUMVA|nr:hypothetical protein EVAR_55218_1 [Eumeta japonica]
MNGVPIKLIRCYPQTRRGGARGACACLCSFPRAADRAPENALSSARASPPASRTNINDNCQSISKLMEEGVGHRKFHSLNETQQRKLLQHVCILRECGIPVFEPSHFFAVSSFRKRVCAADGRPRTFEPHQTSQTGMSGGALRDFPPRQLDFRVVGAAPVGTSSD